MLSNKFQKCCKVVQGVKKKMGVGKNRCQSRVQRKLSTDKIHAFEGTMPVNLMYKQLCKDCHVNSPQYKCITINSLQAGGKFC